jgi:hypothetical protein
VARGARHAPQDIVKVWRCAASPSWQINFDNRHNIQTVPNQRRNQHRQRGGKTLLDIRGRRRLCITAKLAARSRRSQSFGERQQWGRTVPFDAWLSNVRYRFLSPVSCHSAIGQTKPPDEWPIFESVPRSGPTGVHPHCCRLPRLHKECARAILRSRIAVRKRSCGGTVASDRRGAEWQ